MLTMFNNRRGRYETLLVSVLYIFVHSVFSIVRFWCILYYGGTMGNLKELLQDQAVIHAVETHELKGA